MAKLPIKPKRKNQKKREQMQLDKALQEKCNHNIKDLLSAEELELLNKWLKKDDKI